VLRFRDGDLAGRAADEGVARDRDVRVRVPGELDRWTAVGIPAGLGVEVRWPVEGPFPGRVRRYVATNDVRVER
jgi:hypothetical protein